jgi:long-subunit fatty acid transport protein
VKKASLLLLFLLTFSSLSYGQFANSQKRGKWRFGGNIGGTFGNTTSILVAPSAIYDYNKYLSWGGGITFQYAGNNLNSATRLGVNLIGLVNPIEMIQFSTALEYSRIKFSDQLPSYIPSLFLGIGYRTENVTVGLEYDVLHEPGKSPHLRTQPFIRVYF